MWEFASFLEYENFCSLNHEFISIDDLTTCLVVSLVTQNFLPSHKVEVLVKNDGKSCRRKLKK